MEIFNIRRVLLSLVFLSSSFSLYADDVIVFRNGDILIARVIEVSTSEVKYKKISNPNGPIYSAEKSTILSIKYENGEIDIFETPSTQTSSSTSSESQQSVKAPPAEDNAKMKALYEVMPRLNLKTKNKICKDFFPIMAFTESSVISTNELTIFVEPEGAEFYDGGWKVKIGYVFSILNKTDAPIYIDRANCFRRYLDGDTKQYYNNKQYTVTNSNSSGITLGIGVGGIGIASGNTSGSSNTETFGVDRILTIAPESKANLVDYEYIRLSKNKAEFETVSDIEYWAFNLLSESDMTEGQVKTYTENSSPYKNMYYITYSKDPEFRTSYNMSFELYAKHIVAAKMKKEKWSMAQGPTKMIEEIQKIVPEFWSESLVIVGTPGIFKY